MEAKILFVLEIDNCSIIECKILNILNNDKLITKRTDIGKEYFYCANKNYIKQLIILNVNNYLIEIINMPTVDIIDINSISEDDERRALWRELKLLDELHEDDSMKNDLDV